MRGREVNVIGVIRIPFVPVDVGVLPTKFKEAAKRVVEIDIPKLEAESGLVIKAEHPYNKSLYSGISTRDLALVALHELFRKFGINPEYVEKFILGSVISHKTDENNIHAFAKVVAILAGMKNVNDAFTLDKACSSALKAMGLAYQAISGRDADLAIAGGIEKMSDVPDRLVRFGLTNPFDGQLMAALADEVAQVENLTRGELDDYAFGSCQRAASWQGKHRFLAPVKVADNLTVKLDEKIERRAVDRRVFAKSPRYPQYAEREDSPKCEMVTPLNSAQYADGGGFMALASNKFIRDHKLISLAKIRAFATAGGETPKNFILRPEEAIQKCLDAEGLDWKNIGHIEDNEAFAVGQVLCMKRHNIERDRINRRGGAISHGHAIGGTTGSLGTKAVDIMNSDKERYVIVTACNAVDEAPAMLLENTNV